MTHPDTTTHSTIEWRRFEQRVAQGRLIDPRRQSDRVSKQQPNRPSRRRPPSSYDNRKTASDLLREALLSPS